MLIQSEPNLNKTLGFNKTQNSAALHKFYRLHEISVENSNIVEGVEKSTSLKYPHLNEEKQNWNDLRCNLKLRIITFY